MSSYHGDKTAQVMNEMRRDAKRRQSRGSGRRTNEESPEKKASAIKESREYVPRHFVASLPEELVREVFTGIPAGILVTAKAFFDLMMAGKLNVILCGENAKLVGMDGTIINIGTRGFNIPGGNQPPVMIWSITFETSGGYGIHCRWDPKARQMIMQ